MKSKTAFFWTKLSTVGAFLILISAPGLAAVIKDVRFADTVIVDQTVLEVRGVAVFKWALLLDVYAGAFYLPEDHPAQAWEKDVPKRLELAYFREIKAKDFVDSSDHLLRRNLSAAEYQALEERLDKFWVFFRDVKPGDRYLLNYSPANGTELSLNDQSLGVIPGADFAAAYFGIWLGREPISKNFRDRLLNNS